MPVNGQPDSTKSENGLRSIPEPRSKTVGDVPEAIRRRYYTEERGGPGLGFYVDASIVTPAFRDRGREIVSPRADPNAIRDMLEIARHRGWRSIEVKGSAEFRREAWLAGRATGLEMWGYRAGEREIQELERRQARTQRAEDRREVKEERRDRAADERGERRGDASVARQLRVVEAVVRARVVDPKAQERIMSAARQRIADWLDRGAQFNGPRQERGRSPERQRSR